jgi:hypothetical protein
MYQTPGKTDQSPVFPQKTRETIPKTEALEEPPLVRIEFIILQGSRQGFI